MTIIHKLKLDLQRKGQLQRIDVVQGDTFTRQVDLVMQCGGKDWMVPICDPVVRYSKPDGTEGIYDTLPDGRPGILYGACTITVELAPQMLTCPGPVQVQVDLIQQDRKLATFAFLVVVAPGVALSGESENYVNWTKAFLPQTTEAKVGQYLKISEVDADGRVVAVVPVNAPSGGSGNYPDLEQEISGIRSTAEAAGVAASAAKAAADEACQAAEQLTEQVNSLTTGVGNAHVAVGNVKIIAEAAAASAAAAQQQAGAAFTTRQEFSPDYTNRVSTSEDEDGSIFNGSGWMAGKQIGSDGSIIDTPSTYVTGFIAVKPGDVIRIKDPGRMPFSTGVCFALYKSDKAIATGIGKSVSNIQSANNNDCGVLTIDGNVATWTLNPINYYVWKDFAWLRVTTFSADMVVTVNEPLTESTKDQLILKPTVKVTKDSLDMDLSNKPLSGKTVVGFGDSIFGYVRDETSVLSVVAKETGATVYNVGFGGCRMSVHPTNGYAAFSMWALAKAVADKDWTTQEAQASSGSGYFPEQLALLKSIDFNNVDMVVIHYGANDFMAGGTGVAIDNANDPDDYTTMCGALRYSVEKLLTAYPHLQIYVSLPTYFYRPDTGAYPETYINAQGKYYRDYVDALRSTAGEYHLPVIDCHDGFGVNKLNVAAMTSDGAHHNQIGRQLLGEFIAGHLSGRQNSSKGGMDTAAVNSMISAAIGDAIGGSY